jgi:hypothetical protein
MSNYIKLSTPSVAPKVEWFENLPLTEGVSYRVVRREVRDLNSIITTDDDGHERNVVRSVGTDQNNKNSLKSSISVKGVLIDAQPPYIFDNGKLLDGFTRFQALTELQYSRWIFNVVEVKDGFTADDVINEVGLGANDHPPSKGASIDDFKKRLASWIARHAEIPAYEDCIRWVNQIPHSFTQQQVTNLCESVISNAVAAASMESFDANKAKNYAKKVLPKGTNVVALNASGNSTYFRRAVIEALESFYAGKDTRVVAFLQNTTAEDAPEARLACIERVNYYNECFEKAYQARFQDSNFKLFPLEGFVPQILDVEDNDGLIKA